MKKLFAAFATLIACLSPGTAQILIDGFLDNTIEVVAPDSPSSVITNDIDASNIDRQISVEAAGDLSIVSAVLDGFFVVDAASTGPGSANVEIEYLGFELNLLNNTFFQFDTTKVDGNLVLGLILGDANLGQISGGISLTASNQPQSYFLDITQFTGYTPGFGNRLNSIQVIIGGADEAFFAEGDSLQFTSVPEPSSILLLAGGLFGLTFRLRRGRTRSH